MLLLAKNRFGFRSSYETHSGASAPQSRQLFPAAPHENGGRQIRPALRARALVPLQAGVPQRQPQGEQACADQRGEIGRRRGKGDQALKAQQRRHRVKAHEGQGQHEGQQHDDQ